MNQKEAEIDMLNKKHSQLIRDLVEETNSRLKKVEQDYNTQTGIMVRLIKLKRGRILFLFIPFYLMERGYFLIKSRRNFIFKDDVIIELNKRNSLTKEELEKHAVLLKSIETMNEDLQATIKLKDNEISDIKMRFSSILVLLKLIDKQAKLMHFLPAY